MKRNWTNKVKGFTIAEVMVTLALTSVTIVFAYSTLGYIQKLFYSYKNQSRFINEFTDFKMRMDFEALNSETVIEGDENVFSIKRDSSIISLELLKEVVLLKNAGHCDTFHFCAKQIIKEYELLNNSGIASKLIKSLKFETQLSKQKFVFLFDKTYDASTKLRFNRTE